MFVRRVFGTVGSIALSKSRRCLSSKASSSKCRRSITSLQYATPHLFFRAHTAARNSRNRVRMSSTSQSIQLMTHNVREVDVSPLKKRSGLERHECWTTSALGDLFDVPSK